MERQKDDGSWSSPMDTKGKRAEGETISMFKTKLNLEVYCVALCVMTLDVHYRFLPEFDIENGTMRTTPNSDINDADLGLEIR